MTTAGETNVSLPLEAVAHHQQQQHGHRYPATEKAVTFIDDWIRGPEHFRQALQERLRDAWENEEEESHAATTIQSCYRGSVIRELILLQSYACMEIQRVFRGHISRKICSRMLSDRDRKRLEQFQHLCAVNIQKIYRGYRSRKYVHDFYARRAYIFDVTEKGQQLRKTLKEELQAQIENKLVQEEEKAMEEFDKVTQNLHHLMSTKAQSGVFNPQYAEHPEQIPSSFNIPVEEHLERGVKRYLRTRGLRTATAFQSSDRSPRSYLGTSETVRISSPYESEKEKERQEKRLNELQQISDQPYRPVTKPEDLKPYQTVRSSDAYEEPWRLARSTKEFENAPENIMKRVGYSQGQSYFITSNKKDRIFEDLERERLHIQTTCRQFQSRDSSQRSTGSGQRWSPDDTDTKRKQRGTTMARHGKMALNPSLPRSVRKEAKRGNNHPKAGLGESFSADSLQKSST